MRHVYLLLVLRIVILFTCSHRTDFSPKQHEARRVRRAINNTINNTTTNNSHSRGVAQEPSHKAFSEKVDKSNNLRTSGSDRTESSRYYQSGSIINMDIIKRIIPAGA